MQNDEVLKDATEEIAPEEQAEAVVVETAAEGEAAAEPSAGEEAEQADERDKTIEELKNRLLRLQADFDNFRRRTNQEQSQLAGFVTVGVVAKFLKVLDNFERAEVSMTKATDGESIKVGMEKIRKQFTQALTELKVEEIEAEGKPFNPEVHEAVMRGENPDLPADTVEMVLEKGYKIGDRIVRHSKVKVVNNS